MKKTLIATGIMAAILLSTSISYAADNKTPQKPCDCPCARPMPPKHFEGQKPPKMERPDIEERLNLTEEQKQKAHEIRMNGQEKMKPVFAKMQAKKQEIKKVTDSNLSQDQKDKKITQLKEELQAVKNEAKNIRTENRKEFEAILTPEQKAEFEKIKQEGKDRVKRYHEEAKNQPCNKKPQK